TASDAVHQLRLIGLDMVDGYWTAGALSAWSAQGHELATVQRADAASIVEILKCKDVTTLDVREPAEVAIGAIAGSRNIPLGYLTRRLPEVPRDSTVVVYCQGGTRSSIAASLLSAAGYGKV